MTDMHSPPANRPSLSTGLNLAVNYGPLLMFFAANKFGGLFVATGVFMAAMLVGVAVSWLKTRHVPPMLLLTFAIVVVFGGLTLWLQDETFIKLKPTLIYGIFAAILFFGMATGRPTLQIVLDGALPGIDREGWAKLTRNWALYFVLMMVANEVARRVLTTDQWVNFKVWGVTLAFFLFAIAQGPLMSRHGLKLGDEPEK